jgi:hypothetical protein
MSYPGYQHIKILARNLGEFEKLTETSGEMAKVKYIKYVRMRSRVFQFYRKKQEYVKSQDYEKACNMRDEEVRMTKMILEEFYKNQSI